MKVLIVKVSALGDVVHALPVLAYLRSADPQMAIDWLVEESFAPLLEGHPLIRKVIRLRTKAWRRQGAGQGAWQSLAAGAALRRERYDVVLDLQGNSKSGLFTLLSGAPLRFGFDRTGTREWPNRLATNRKVTLGADAFHVSDRSLAVARAAFPGGSLRPLAGPLAADPGAMERVELLLRERGLSGQPVVVFHYGTTWQTKLWSLENWQRLADRLCDTGVQPLLTWGNDDELAAAEAIRAASGERCLVWPRGTLPELVALLQRADLVVGGDTGPIHIAAAVGTPTVSLFRVTDARRNGPRGEGHLCLQTPLDCSPCLRKSCPRDRECAASIAVEAVLEAVTSRLGGMAWVRS
jgi:heptosyltransferase-1